MRTYGEHIWGEKAWCTSGKKKEKEKWGIGIWKGRVEWGKKSVKEGKFHWGHPFMSLSWPRGGLNWTRSPEEAQSGGSEHSDEEWLNQELEDGDQDSEGKDWTFRYPEHRIRLQWDLPLERLSMAGSFRDGTGVGKIHEFNIKREKGWGWRWKGAKRGNGLLWLRSFC